jgi:hypothetical protein
MTAPTTPVTCAPGIAARESEWRRRLAAFALAWLAFETLSGLAVWLLPFSAANQWTVVVHTGFGVVFLVPALVYLIRHLAVYWTRPLNATVLMGYLAGAAALAAVVSGVVLTAQALFGRLISYAWDTVHIVSTFALVAFVVPHLLVILLRDRMLRGRPEAAGLLRTQRAALLRSGALAAVLALPVLILWAAYPADRLDHEFPAGYTFPYGPDRPFAPSLARTETGRAYDARLLSGSESCGTSGCHEQITAEWRVSAHRWAAMDPGFQRIQEEMAKQNGPESTRYCGGCHDPISLFSGAKTIFNERLTDLAGYQEGVSCLACHAIRKTDLAGNANYTVAMPTRYLFELRAGDGARLMRDFLIRAYPRRHVEDLSKRLFKTPEYCAACHKQFIDQEVNNVGWVQLQNQYDNWRKSRWNHPGDPRKTIECRECHMPLVRDSSEPAAGDGLDYNRDAADGSHRSHRFIGANQAMPALLKIPGAGTQVAMTEKWLRGEFEIPEIAHKWAGGPAVAIELVAPAEAAPGEDVPIQAVVTSNKVGHDFPTGPLDIIQSWVELRVTDAAGAELFASGTVDERHFIRPGAFMFKAEPVDQYGNLIDRHNLWEMVGVRYRRSLFPGFSDTAEYSFRCPGGSDGVSQPTGAAHAFRFAAPAGTAGPLRITARLLYRKVDQYLLNFMFGEDSGLTMPVTEMARAEATLRVGQAAGAAAAPGSGGPGAASAAPAAGP